jgi:pyrroline-5-carboxylate reductase
MTAPESLLPARMWIIGCGAMAGALLTRWLAAGLDPASFTVIDPEPKGLPAGFTGTRVADVAQAGPLPDAVLLGIKPQLLALVGPALAARVDRPVLLISMLAGVRTHALAHLLPSARIIRIMPNLPARIGAGATAMFAAGATAADTALADRLMAAAGTVHWLDDEGRFDAVTAVSGSGPGFLFRFIEALAGAGEAAGLDAEMAAGLALQTVVGAAALAAQSRLTPATLRQQVTSPNGTTQAGLDVLDGDGALSALMRATVRAAAERSRALAATAEAVKDASIGRGA